MTTNDNFLDAKLCSKYYCKTCNYNTSKKSSFDKHVDSNKHKNNEMTTNNNGLVAKLCSSKYTCKKCEKNFNDRAGLWRHNKKCSENETTNEIQELKEFMKYLMKENSEMKNIVMEIVKTGATNNTYNNNTTHTNSHNKAFNLNFFLNETCKDAMNIMDFVESIKLQVTDLERVGEVGYVEGISNIIVSNLNKLDITQRPIHCTDKKRETMYIKDAGKWEKDENTNLIRRAIRKVTHNNQRLLPQFKEKYPDYHNSYSSHSDKVTKVVIETMVNNIPEKEEKIIKNIAKSVVLDKTYSL